MGRRYDPQGKGISPQRSPGTLLGASWPSWGPLGSLGCFGALLGRSGGRGPLLGALGAILGPTWSQLGGKLASKTASERPLEAIFGAGSVCSARRGQKATEHNPKQANLLLHSLSFPKLRALHFQGGVSSATLKTKSAKNKKKCNLRCCLQVRDYEG